MTAASADSNSVETVPWLCVLGARHHNLKNIDVRFPLGRFVAVTGVSGSGKSSLVTDILLAALERDLNGAHTQPGQVDRIVGLEHLDKVVAVDQSPIGRTPRSNPATYTKVFDLIRDLFARLPAAKARGYLPGRFSFNVSGGRCEACEGNGSKRLEMDFLADVWVTCPVCEGRRFNRETLHVRFKDKSIHDILEMDVQEALEHFENVPRIREMLQTLHDVGLDYLKLGQPSPTLSGGEAQRIKLSRELARRATGRTLYILDEPTTGLHFDDVKKLLRVLHGLVDAGNTVVVIEHNLDVVKTADWVIDLGPDGGAGGGWIVAVGTPEQIAEHPGSYTGEALRPVLARSGGGRSSSPTVRTNGRKRAERSRASSRARPITHLTIEGARQHNLKDVSARLPLHQMSVFCGPSGSGKSSLAIDTLYAEGQRRYIESLSAYARQFLGQMQKPNVERVIGLPPAVCIEQKSASKSPRSTVGTVTEIYDYWRVLMARLGQPFCPECQLPIGTQTSEEIIDKLMLLPDGVRVYLMAPIQRDQVDDYETLWGELRRSGFVRMRVDGVTYEIDRPPAIDRRRRHAVEVIVDRAVIRHNQRSRIADSVEAALELGRGVLHLAHVDPDSDERQWKVERFSQHFACDRCGRSFEELTPNHYSFNSPIGWCPACEGLGVQAGAGPSAISDRPELSLRQGAISVWPNLFDPDNPLVVVLEALARRVGFSLDDPFEELRPEHKRAILYGARDEWIDLGDGLGTRFQYKGIFPAVSEAKRVSWVYRQRLSDLVGEVPCPTCKGSRLRDDAASVRLGGRTIHDWCSLSLDECLNELDGLSLSTIHRQIAGEILREIRQRLRFLVDVGLEYLTLARPTPTLSGGEAQRIRLASQLGSGLTGVLYLLDEPTIGLHPRDNARLLGALTRLRDLGNTLILVEHDREVICAADHLLDFGPGAGHDGGQVVGSGTPEAVMANRKSLTGRYLSGREAITVPINRRSPDGPCLEVVGAAHHNLQRVDVRFPLGCFIAVTGVSGSGKSSLVNDVLAAALARRLHRANVSPGLHEEIRGLEHIDKIICVDQQPIGNTPSSNPATYTGVFDLVRELFAQLPESRMRGYHPVRFSFNKPGGRCEICEGNGQRKIEMHFLPDVWIECDTCKGKRYTPETLAVKVKGKSIADVLEMTVDGALALFANFPKLRRLLETLSDVGLGYMPLGQSAPTLSGGEAQRVKLAAELARPNTGRTFYVLDEPTTGLHFDDLRKLLAVLARLVDLGNTVVVIEHNLDVIKTADWVIDMGPEAGDQGGRVVFAGPPERLVEYAKSVGDDPSPRSHTGLALWPVLERGPYSDRSVYRPSDAPAQTEEMEISDLGRDVRMPWEIDGRRWHTTDRVSRNGKPCKWEGAALAWVVDEIQRLGVFAPTDWSDRWTVEITGPRKSDGWFLHAHTGEEWLLRFKFRPARGAFKAELLDRRLKLKPLDELREVPLYSPEPRVRVRRLRSLFQEVELTVFRLAEIQTTAFSEFLERAVHSFFVTLDRQTCNPDEARPWTIDGEKWHRSAKGFRPGRPVRWDRDVLDSLLRLLAEAAPAGAWDWNSRDSVKRRFPNIGPAWARIMTKLNRALELILVGPKGRFNLADFDRFGVDQELGITSPHHDSIRIAFVSVDDFSEGPFIDFLARHADAFAAAFSKVGQNR
jgi:excinuclease ABC subunit A